MKLSSSSSSSSSNDPKTSKTSNYRSSSSVVSIMNLLPKRLHLASTASPSSSPSSSSSASSSSSSSPRPTSQTPNSNQVHQISRYLNKTDLVNNPTTDPDDRHLVLVHDEMESSNFNHHHPLSEEEFASADEGDESFWKSTQRLTLPTSSPHSIRIKIDSSSIDDHHHHHHHHIHNNPSKPSSRLHGHRPSTSLDGLMSPELSRPFTLSRSSSRSSILPTRPSNRANKAPPEFRAGRVFRSSYQLTEYPQFSHSILDQPQHQSTKHFSRHLKPILSLTPRQSKSISSFSPSEDHVKNSKDCGMLSRIAEPFNSFLSPSHHYCLSPTSSRPSSVHSLACRFNSGVLNRPPSKSTSSSRSSQLADRPQPSKSLPNRKAISMNFNLKQKIINSKSRAAGLFDEDRSLEPKSLGIQIIPKPSADSHPSSHPQTWRSLIPPNEFAKLDQQFGSTEMKRQEVIWELCQTELQYISSLKTITRMFYEPLSKVNQPSLTCPQSDHQQHSIIRSPLIPLSLLKAVEKLEEIINLHQQIYDSIQLIHQTNQIDQPLAGKSQSLTNGDDQRVILKISDTFQVFIHQFRIYQDYLIGFESLNELIEENMQDPSSELGSFIRTQSESQECGRMSFNSFLLKPIQRLMKYPLFFKQLCDLTSPSHPDYEAAQKLWQSTDQVIKEMQEVKVREDELKVLKLVESQIEGLDINFSLQIPNRKLIQEGFVRPVQSEEYNHLESDHHSQQPLPVNNHSIPADSRRHRSLSPVSFVQPVSPMIKKRLRPLSQISSDESSHINLTSDFASPQKSSQCSHSHPCTCYCFLPSKTDGDSFHSFSHVYRDFQLLSAETSPIFPPSVAPLSPEKQLGSPVRIQIAPKPKTSKSAKSPKLDSSTNSKNQEKQPVRKKISINNIEFAHRKLKLSTSHQSSQHKTHKKKKNNSSDLEGDGESLYLFMFSDGLLIFAHQLDHDHHPHTHLKKSEATEDKLADGRNSKYRVIQNPYGVSKLIGFRILNHNQSPGSDNFFNFEGNKTDFTAYHRDETDHDHNYQGNEQMPTSTTDGERSLVELKLKRMVGARERKGNEREDDGVEGQTKIEESEWSNRGHEYVYLRCNPAWQTRSNAPQTSFPFFFL